LIERRDTASRCVLNGVLPLHAEATRAAASILRAIAIIDKYREIRVRRRAQASAMSCAENFVKVISLIQSGRYTRCKEYRFKQSSA
jgi:hypothetical protein